MDMNYQNHEGVTAQAAGVDAPAVQPENAAAVNPYLSLEEWLQEFFGEEFRLDDVESQDALKEYLRRNIEQNKQLAAVLEQDPRLGQLLADIVYGKRSAHAAMARYYGKSFLDFEEGSPEYEEMLQLDEERRREAYEIANNRRAYEENLEKSRPVIEGFCRERGYDPSEFLDNVWEQLVFPILSGAYSAEVCQALDHAVTYEKDVEDAFAAGNVKGRNTNIRRMQETFGDGMPKGINSVAPVQQERPDSTNSLIDSALKA
jgi:hypothetical protein